MDAFRRLETCYCLDAFAGILGAATARVAGQYFTFHTAHHVEPIERERVYCYELYHQLRQAWTKRVGRRSRHTLAGYSLNGEVDKSGHAAFAGVLSSVKPDFIVHAPGRMDANLVAVEVKRSSAETRSLVADLQKLHAMISQARYKRGVLLIFGREHFSVDELLATVPAEVLALIETTEIQVWVHSAPLTQAVPILGACMACRDDYQKCRRPLGVRQPDLSRL